MAVLMAGFLTSCFCTGRNECIKPGGTINKSPQRLPGSNGESI
jgi:hypothetical protein